MMKSGSKQFMAAMFAVVLAFVFTQPQAFAAEQAKKKQAQTQEYHSSIQVPDDERADTAEKNGKKGEDPSEEAKYKSLAKITKEQAIAAASAKVKGKVMHAELENEDGNLVYGVEIKTKKGTADVKVDPGTGKVLHIDRGND